MLTSASKRKAIRNSRYQEVIEIQDKKTVKVNVEVFTGR